MRDKSHDILFIITGGTIDSLAEGYTGIAFFSEGQKSLIPDYIENNHKDSNCEFMTICMKDSDDIIAGDNKILQNITNIIEENSSRNIIITCGTDAMAEIARYLKNSLHNNNFLVILTGAIIPLRAENTDGYSNLDYAIEEISKLNQGIYLAMNKQIFPADNVRKDKANKQFVRLFTD